MIDSSTRVFVSVSAGGVFVLLAVVGIYLIRRVPVGGVAAITFWFVLGIEYCLRPLAVIGEGQLGWDVSSFRQLGVGDSRWLTSASYLSLLGVASFVFGLRLSFGSASNSRVQLPETEDLVRRKGMSPVVLLMLALLASSSTASQYGNLGASIEGVFGRQRIGSGYLYSLVNLVAVCVIVVLAVTPRENLMRARLQLSLLLASCGFVLIHILILGGRAEILIFALGVATITFGRFRRPRLKTLAVLALLGAIGLGVLRVATREAFYLENRSTSRTQLVVDSLKNPISLITRGDVSAYDKLVMMERRPDLVGGETTYLSALAAPLPGKSSLALRSGNRVFTERFIPGRFSKGVTFEGISYLGEARFNMGWLGIPFAGVLLGTFYGWVLARSVRSSPWLIASALSLGMFPSIIRADAFNNVALAGSLSLVSLMCFYAVRRMALGRKAGPSPKPFVDPFPSSRRT